LWHKRYMKPTIGRRYFCTRKAKADSSPVLTRSITSTSERAASGPELAAGVAAAKFERARSGIAPFSSPRSMATLLTLVETPFGAESCEFSGVVGRGEVFSPESLTGRASGMSEAGMKGRWKEAIGSGGNGQEAGWMPFPCPQRLKPGRIVDRFRSGEPPRHPKSNAAFTLAQRPLLRRRLLHPTCDSDF